MSTFKRILDPHREYRGSHTHPDTDEECYGQLAYEELEPASSPAIVTP